MMMAHDSTPRPELSAASIEALRSALVEYLERSSETAALQPVLRRIAAEAREKRIQPEQLLVVLKDVWYGLPQLSNQESETQTRLMQRVVTLCIREYYSSPSRPQTPND